MLFASSEKGQGLLEFVLGLALLAVVVIVGVKIVTAIFGGVDAANCGDLEAAIGACKK